MKVYRGPASTEFMHQSHELVAEVKPSVIEEKLTSHQMLQFNVSKIANDRKAVCSLGLDGEDAIPMIKGMLAKLTDHISAKTSKLERIKKMLASKKTDEEKLGQIRRIINSGP